ncbi:Pleckstrin y domain containing, G (with RhoGef domain) member [Sparganum proliferum]
MLGRSEDSLSTFSRDILPQPSEARMNPQLKSASSRALSVSTLGESTDFSRADSWSFSRSQQPRLMSAYSSPTLNLQSASGAKMRMCESGNWNEAYDIPVFTQFALQSSAITEHQEQEVQRYLAAYARGSLPKIPKDYIDDFPQGLAREKATFLDALADSSATQTNNPAIALTKGDTNKRCNQQRAIMELVQTEANYIKVLEMMIDVHVAVFLELNKPTTGASIPSRLGSYRSYYSSGGSMHRRRRDSLFEKIRHTNRRRIRSHTSITNISNGTFSETSSFQNFGSTNSLSSISAPQRPQPIPDVSDIFGNLGQIYRANVKFWEDCFEPCFSGSPPGEPKLTVKKLKAAFLKFETYFEPYVEYLKHCHSIISNVKTLEVKNRLFAAYTEWTTYHNTLHHRESLTSLLRKPFQRSMQYGLLLQRIKDETRDPEEICDLDEMLSVVNEFVKKIESGIPEHEERLKLEKFLQRIEGYSYLKALPEGLLSYADSLADLKTRLRQPVSVAGKNKYRIPLTELPAKVKFSNGKIREAVCILLTDQILICKEMRKSNSLSVCRPPIPLSRAQLVSKSGLLAIIERGEWSYIKEIYTIIAESIPLKAWSDQVRQAKRTLDLALEVPPTSSQSCYTASSESRTPGFSPMSSVHRFPATTEADTRRTRTLPASTGRLGYNELPHTTVVKRPTVPLPKTAGRTAAEMSRTVSIPDDFQRQTSSQEDVACSSSGSISDSIGGQVTDSTSSRNNSLKSSDTNTSRGEEKDGPDGLRRSDFPVKTEVNVTVGSEKRKRVTSMV